MFNERCEAIKRTKGVRNDDNMKRTIEAIKKNGVTNQGQPINQSINLFLG